MFLLFYYILEYIYTLYILFNLYYIYNMYTYKTNSLFMFCFSLLFSSLSRYLCFPSITETHTNTPNLPY